MYIYYAKNLCAIGCISWMREEEWSGGLTRARKKELLMKYYQNNDVDLEFD